MNDNKLAKINILIDQKKYAEAERFIKDLLSEDAHDIDLLALLSEVKMGQHQLDVAEEVINTAIGLAPNYAYLFYIKSRIMIQKSDFVEAEKNIQEAIQLDPYDSDFFALLSLIKMETKLYEEALTFANKALEFDSENLLGLNTRSTALLKLNRTEDSFETIRGALRHDPNDAYTHTNYGWGLLEKGDHKKALEHFKEALTNDPTFEYAQAGMLEAIKATNPIYRLFLKYSFWIGNLTEKYQWAVIIGFYMGFKVLRSIAANNEALQPILTPLLILLAVIAFSTWVINPISNLFLRFNPYGQFLLEKNEKMSSNFVAVSFLVFIVGIISYFVFSDIRFLSVAAFGFAMMVPLSVMFSVTKRKNLLLIYTIAMAVIGIAAINITFTTGEIFNLMTSIFIIGFVAFQWIANFFLIRN